MARQQISSFGIVLALVVLSALRIFMASDPFSQVVNRVVLPISSITSYLQFESVVSDPAALNDEKVLQLTQQITQLEEQLSLPKARGVTTTKAEIIFKNVQTYRQTAVINIGAREGVVNNAAVMSEGQLIGIVYGTQSASARVRFMTDPDFRVAVVEPKTKAEGIIKTTSGALLLTQASSTDPTLQGRVLLTSGLGGLFPPNILVGEVGSLLSKPDSAFGTYSVRKQLPYASMRYVDVEVRSEQ